MHYPTKNGGQFDSSQQIPVILVSQILDHPLFRRWSGGGNLPAGGVLQSSHHPRPEEINLNEASREQLNSLNGYQQHRIIYSSGNSCLDRTIYKAYIFQYIEQTT